MVLKKVTWAVLNWAGMVNTRLNGIKCVDGMQDPLHARMDKVHTLSHSGNLAT